MAELKLSGHGRIFLRESGTEPGIRILVECEDRQTIIQMVNYLADAVREVQEFSRNNA